VLAEIARALALIAHGDVEVWEITGVSVVVSTSAVIGAVAIGLPLTYVLTRSGSRATKIGMWFAHSAAALPTVVVGLTLYFVLSSAGPLGWTKLLYTRTAMALGQFVLALPLLVAVVLGAPHVTPARRMAWLLWEVRAAIASATFLAFSRAFTELGSALIVGGNIRGATRTLTTYVALEYNRGDDARAIALGLILLAVALTANALMHAFMNEQ
jgi:tungstate transport system permease protein